MVLPVLVVDVPPRDSGVEVVLADSVAVVDTEVDKVTSELFREDLEQKAKAKLPLLNSYAGSGASNFSPNGKGNPPDFETIIAVGSSVRGSAESSLGLSLEVRAF